MNSARATIGIRSRLARAVSVAILASIPLAALAAPVALKAPDVESVGALMDIIHGGQRQARVALTKAIERPHAFALGALAGLDGEFAIVDGAVWVTRPSEDGTLSTTNRAAASDSATLMVLSYVPQWHEFPVLRDLSAADLATLLASLGAKSGLPSGGPFPFTIDGPIHHVRWHVVDGRQLPPGPSTHEAHQAASVRGQDQDVRGTLVGFYSEHHQGVFTHRGSNLHIHAVLTSKNIAVHVDSVVIGRGAILRLPVVEKGRASNLQTPMPAKVEQATGGGAQARYQITADESGFHPDRVAVPANTRVTLVVTRTTDKTCATEVVIPSLHVNKKLPLNMAVEVTIPPSKKGEIGFACGMDMWKGVIAVE